MLEKVAMTAGGAGGHVTILTSLSQVPSIPPPSPSAFTDVGRIELVTINDIKTKRSIGNPIILLTIRRARTWMLVVFDIDIQTSP
jgi:hypothetical protein